MEKEAKQLKLKKQIVKDAIQGAKSATPRGENSIPKILPAKQRSAPLEKMKSFPMPKKLPNTAPLKKLPAMPMKKPYTPGEFNRGYSKFA